MSCAAPPTGSGFLAATLAHLDCQAQTIGESGYLALSNPGSPVSLALTALLTIFIAIISIRFMMGRPPGADELVPAAIKVGFVLALAASWPAYRVIAYDMTLKAPAEISASIGRASALPGSSGGLAARLQNADNGIMALVAAGSGRQDFDTLNNSREIPPPVRDETALGWGKTVFVSSIIGSFGLVRLAGGLFLALAPLFVGFLLFEATRFLFFGWLRSLIAVALGSLGIAVVLGVELAIIEPWLSQVLALRASRALTLSAPFELLALTLAFSLAMFGVLALTVRISFASDAVIRVRALVNQAAQHIVQRRGSSADLLDNRRESTEPSRAQLVTLSVDRMLRQEALANFNVGGAPTTTRVVIDNRSTGNDAANGYTPLGQRYHTPSRRVGSSALRRKSGS
jgi:type IV secretion system protein VirB6